ncbi:MAG: DUF4405 domain-containing protein [Lentisphaerales bacterium]|nr:DUF4405 domain-containing protein [Lentisphaerales bacterium]
MKNHIVNFGLLYSFLTLAITGVLAFALPFSIETTRVHIIFGFLTTILVLLHLFSKMKYFKKQFTKRGKMIFGSFLIWLILFFAAYEYWLPAKLLVEQSYEARHQREIVRPNVLVASRNEQQLLTSSRVKKDSGELLLSIDVAMNDKDKPFPAVAIWAESKNGTIIETLYLTHELSFSDKPQWYGKETPRHHILPVWRNRYTVINGMGPDGKIDAASGATSKHQFSLDQTRKDKEPFTLFVEINSPADPDEKWPNKHIGQPSVLYSAYIDPEEPQKYYLVDLTGHGGEAQKGGTINYDPSQLSSAKDILDLILIKIAD